MKILARIFAICGLLGLIAAIVGTGIFLSGAYHVGATTRHSAIVNSLLASTMERSVRAHARQVAMPADLRLDDPVEAARGAGHYQEMCVTCHGAPGRDPAEWAKDLHPAPPDLTQPAVAKHWSDAEIFWIIKYGIKDTGMAALVRPMMTTNFGRSPRSCVSYPRSVCRAMMRWSHKRVTRDTRRNRKNTSIDRHGRSRCVTVALRFRPRHHLHQGTIHRGSESPDSEL